MVEDRRKYRDFQDFMTDMDRIGFRAFDFTNIKLRKMFPGKHKEYLELKRVQKLKKA